MTWTCSCIHMLTLITSHTCTPQLCKSITCKHKHHTQVLAHAVIALDINFVNLFENINVWKKGKNSEHIIIQIARNTKHVMIQRYGDPWVLLQVDCWTWRSVDFRWRIWYTVILTYIIGVGDPKIGNDWWIVMKQKKKTLLINKIVVKLKFCSIWLVQCVQFFASTFKCTYTKWLQNGGVIVMQYILMYY